MHRVRGTACILLLTERHPVLNYACYFRHLRACRPSATIQVDARILYHASFPRAKMKLYLLSLTTMSFQFVLMYLQVTGEDPHLPPFALAQQSACPWRTHTGGLDVSKTTVNFTGASGIQGSKATWPPHAATPGTSHSS